MYFKFDGQFRTKNEWCRKLIMDILSSYASDQITVAMAATLRTRQWVEAIEGYDWHIVVVQTQMFERYVGCYRKVQQSDKIIFEVELDDPANVAWAFKVTLDRIMTLYNISESDLPLVQIAWGPQENMKSGPRRLTRRSTNAFQLSI